MKDSKKSRHHNKKQTDVLIEGVFKIEPFLRIELSRQVRVFSSNEIENTPSRLGKLHEPAEEIETAPSRLGKLREPAEEIETAPSRLGKLREPAEEIETAPSRLGKLREKAEEIETAPSRLGKLREKAKKGSSMGGFISTLLPELDDLAQKGDFLAARSKVDETYARWEAQRSQIM